MPETPTTLLPTDPPALRRLGELQRRDDAAAARQRHPAGRGLAARSRHPTARIEVGHGRKRGRPRFGYQAGLDGLRALSVLAVILYHAGFSWMRGGWIGVEVFFVVSGFLITSLLLDERARSGAVRVTDFWRRRARRLLPALVVVLAAVAVWALVAGTDAQLAQLRRDYPWALLYAGNWSQIVGDVPYLAGDPPLLRHLWSLAIEEQFYLVWPLVFVALTGSRLGRRRAAGLVAALALSSMLPMIALHAAGSGPNFLYLSTFTRAGGLLAGAAAAFVWRPWRVGKRTDASPPVGRVLDVVGGAAAGMLGCIAVVAVLTDAYVYQWLLPVVSVLALIAVIVVVHPAAVGMRKVFGWWPVAAIGRRSYGLYLWHWPIFVFLAVPHGSFARFVLALALTIVCSELCYRLVELPVRRGAFGGWWRAAGPQRIKVLAAGAMAVVVLAAAYTAVGPYDRAVGGQATFDAPRVTTAAPVTNAPAAATPTTTRSPTAAASLPRRVAIVGDSQAYALANNLPAGVDETFDITDGAVVGCSVYDEGRMRSARDGYTLSFEDCSGWQDEWASAVRESDADVALVVLGAWDVFDLETGDGDLLSFGTADWDTYVTSNVQSGIDALTASGAKVALLEVPCMRPRDVEGPGVPTLPERRDDTRVAHVNEVLRSAASANAGRVTFVEGPDEWCQDARVANDVTMRWDGVHVYAPGAELIYETIAPTLLAL